MKEKTRITEFLLANGYEIEQNGTDSTFTKGGLLAIAIDDDSQYLVFFTDDGELLTIPLCYYGLIGVLMEYRQLPFYVSVNQNNHEKHTKTNKQDQRNAPVQGS